MLKIKSYIEKSKKWILPAALFLQAFLLMLGMQYITFADEYILSAWLDRDNLYFLIYNQLLFFLLLFVCYCLFKKILPGYLILGSGMVLLSVINNMKWTALKECVTISDFSKLSEAAKVAGEAEFRMHPGIWLWAAAGILSIFVWRYLDIRAAKPMEKDKRYFRICRSMLLIFSIILLPFFAADMKESRNAQLTEARTADKMGPLVYFLESLSTLGMEEPYSAEKAEASYYAYVEQGKRIAENNQMIGTVREDEKQSPNIIVIMSEAFYDVNQFEGIVSYSENPMAVFNEIKEESSSGRVMVNVYGGSTHFSEFEFLTGWNSKGMNSGSCPYKEYFSKNQPSLAGYLKEAGYYTMALHPYNSYFWNRYGAYPRMGFDKFVDRAQMKYTNMCGYISDDSLTNEIIYQYEKKQEGQPFFCFGVSIQNHIAILNGEEKVNPAQNIDVTFQKNIGYGDAKKEWFSQYVSGISKSGEALKKLTDYFEKSEEPTVIVFFGDHAPSYALDFLKVEEEEELAYSTPYIIWSNYNMEKESGIDMNASFLSTYLLEKLNMPLPAQGYYNLAVHEEYPIESRYLIKDRAGNLYREFSEEQKKEYFNRALDSKKYIQTLLEHTESISDIWSYPE